MLKKLLVVIGAVALIPAGSAFGGDKYPERPIKVVVPFSVGGGGDYIARSWSNELSQALKQPVVIENKGGGGTVIGTQQVASADPDGYTVLFVSQAIASNPYLRANMPYQTPGSFAPVAKLITYGMGFAANAQAPYNNVQELIAYGKQNPDKLTVATSGEGSATDLAASQFISATGIKIVKVPFKGSGAAATAVASGHVDLVFTGMSQLKPLIDGNRVKLLATSGEQRMTSLPDVPTVSEQGLPGFNAVVWWGVLAPAGTPVSVVDKLNQALKTSLADPEVKKRLDVIDGVIEVSSPAEYAAFIASEMATFSKLIGPDAKK